MFQYSSHIETTLFIIPLTGVLGDSCADDKDCSMNNSTCDGEKKCSCQLGFRGENGTSVCYKCKFEGTSVCYKCKTKRGEPVYVINLNMRGTSVCYKCKYERISVCYKCKYERTSVSYKCKSKRTSVCYKCKTKRTSVCYKCKYERNQCVL